MTMDEAGATPPHCTEIHQHEMVLTDLRQSVPASYKPSPLGYGSSPVRSSPFRRPESPVSPSPLRHTTPTGSPTKTTGLSGSSRFGRPTTPTDTSDNWTPRGQTKMDSFTSPSQRPTASRTPTSKSLGNGNALSRLQPAQVRTLRDGFQILDRDCDGVVNREDVADMLNQLAPQTVALAAFLNSLADALSALSPSAELLSAFSAFDDDDSGQIDMSMLRDALLNTPPEAGERPLTAAEVEKVVNGFTGRRAFNRNMTAHLGAKRGEVFKYQEFVSSIMGSNGGSEGHSNENSED
ncbi:Myosin regulatory light chain 1 [Paramyrothecium foliicola]|nr:Myosin regulatory light chain 1 [Paramyrothecium foliicola]